MRKGERVKSEKGKIETAARAVACLLLLIFFPSPLLSSANALPDELDALIARIESRYGRMNGLAADFEQRYSGAGVRERVERGRLFLERPRRMRWEYSGRLFIVNGRDVWFYIPADREAVHADAAKIYDARFPFLFLLGQKNLRGEFREITRTARDGDISTLRLVPKRKDTGIREIFVEVTGDGRITRVRQVDEGGAVSDVSLTNMQENYRAPREAFEFRPPPGVRVRKQRG